ncbi:hypothetical protein [Actinomadura rugatobispora]|uniref:Molybdenum ABC transporter substrate-binding protein n=1 Tax=Actinomadura rugatobispora TaxID=1994 RepID=A0ABW0ZYV4_9ACTN|nr:hypothetical protein GCM10010200_040070 [Actinomadura rugatobispora]
MSMTRLAGAVALAGVVLTSTGCGGIQERLFPCNALFDELDSVSRKMRSSGQVVALSSADAPFFRDAASRIRSLGTRIDKGGPAEASKIAAELDAAAASLSRLPPGTTSTAYNDGMTAGGGYINNETLKAACGHAPASGP